MRRVGGAPVLNDVKPEAQPLRQHDRAQPHLKMHVRVRRDDRPGLVAGLSGSPSRRRRASPGACTVACRRCSCRREALLQSRRDLFSPSLTLMGFSNLENSLPSKSLSHAI